MHLAGLCGLSGQAIEGGFGLVTMPNNSYIGILSISGVPRNRDQEDPFQEELPRAGDENPEANEVCRLKREEERIAREMAEKEEEEARAMLEQAAKSGKIKLPTGADKLDKEAILSQVGLPADINTAVHSLR